jgi:hypothetical protein
MPAMAFCRETGQHYPCLVADISQSGARLAFRDGEDAPTQLIVVLPGGVTRCCSVVRRMGNTVGALFVNADVAQELLQLGYCIQRDGVKRIGRPVSPAGAVAAP